MILVTIGFTLYCGLGMGYKRLTIGASGIEAIPNVGLWRWIAVNAGYGATVLFYRATCRTPPPVEDSAAGYHGVSGGYDDDDDNDLVGQGPHVARVA